MKQPANASTVTKEETLAAAGRIGYPVMVRPSYVLGGRAMRIVYDEESLKSFLDELHSVSRGHPVLIDNFLEDAQEVDVDAISDGNEVYVAGVHGAYRERGHPFGRFGLRAASAYAKRGSGRGHQEPHRAPGPCPEGGGPDEHPVRVKGRQVYILEVNPRASRTRPLSARPRAWPWPRSRPRSWRAKN